MAVLEFSQPPRDTLFFDLKLVKGILPHFQMLISDRLLLLCSLDINTIKLFQDGVILYKTTENCKLLHCLYSQFAFFGKWSWQSELTWKILGSQCGAAF